MPTPGKRVGAQWDGPMSSLFVSGKGRLPVRPWMRHELGQLARAERFPRVSDHLGKGFSTRQLVCPAYVTIEG